MQIRGRFSAAMYAQVDIHELTAHTPSEWVKIAVQLGTDDAFHTRMVQAIVASYTADEQAYVQDSSTQPRGVRPLHRYTADCVYHAHV